MKKRVFLFVILLLIFPVITLGSSLGCNVSTNNITVTYNANGGSVSPISENKHSGSAFFLPTPTRTGYVFSGWYTAPNEGTKIGEADDSFAPATDITLYAQWIPGITVFFTTNGGSVSQDALVVLPNGIITLPTPTRGGYVFNGWRDETGVMAGAAGADYVVEENNGKIFQGNIVIVLVAEWRLIVTVTFIGNGAGLSPTPLQAPASSAIVLPAITRDGHIFNGWFTATAGGIYVGKAGDSYIIPISASLNMTLYAQWAPSEVIITYNTNGGDDSPPPELVSTGNSLSLPSTTRSGYTFNGWYSALSGGTRVGGAGDSFTPMTNMTLYAQWTINDT